MLSVIYYMKAPEIFGGKKGINNMKKTLIGLILVVALAVGMLTGCQLTLPDESDAAFKESAAVFTLDVNPGFRVYVKADDTVLKVEATNEDGEAPLLELELVGKSYEAAVEELVDELEAEGYLEDGTGSVLISVEKKAKDISEKLNEKLNSAFEKYDKTISIIEQELTELDEKLEREIKDFADKHNISEGKANLIERIRDEFPELDPEALADMKVGDLRLLLEETSDDIKHGFKKIGDAIEGHYVGKLDALATALGSLEITEDDVTGAFVRIDCEDGKMVYEVRFVYNELVYEIEIDAESGEIIETETEEYVELDIDGIIDGFIEELEGKLDGKIEGALGELDDKLHGILGSLGDKLEGELGGLGDRFENDGEPLTKREIIELVIAELELGETKLVRTEVRFDGREKGHVFTVIIETEENRYYVVVEAYTGTVLKTDTREIPDKPEFDGGEHERPEGEPPKDTPETEGGEGKDNTDTPVGDITEGGSTETEGDVTDNGGNETETEGGNLAA